MHTPNVKAVQADATKYNEEWKNEFDFVLVDAPCSCLGTYRKHPDVFLTRKEEDLQNLAKTQLAILKNAGKYLKVGGAAVYSTCTLFREENDDVVDEFLKDDCFAIEKINLDFDDEDFNDNDGRIRILPHDEYDGFYIAKIRRVK